MQVHQLKEWDEKGEDMGQWKIREVGQRGDWG